MSTVVLVDGMNMVYRCGYTYGSLSTRDGRPTGTIYGSITQLLSLRKHIKESFSTIVFWEGSAPKGNVKDPIPSWRKSIYPAYKGHRKSDKSMDDARAQVPALMEGIKLLRIPQVYVPGLEADDLIGLCAAELDRMGSVDDIVIFSTDKDMYQCVSHKTRVLRMLRGVAQTVRAKQVQQELGIPPALVPAYKALAGDATDHYRSINGIGPKTALRMLQDGLRPSFAEFTDHSRAVQKLYKDHEVSRSWQKVRTCYQIAKIPTEFSSNQGLPIPKSLLREAERVIRLALSAALDPPQAYNVKKAIANWTAWCGEYELYSFLSERRQLFSKVSQ